VGYDSSAEVRNRVKELDLVDMLAKDLASSVSNSDIVFLSIPVGAIAAVGREVSESLKEGAIITDTGSVKLSVIADLEKVLPRNVHFIPAHPVAGTENSGPDAGFEELFIDRCCILTPGPNVDEASIERLASFWRSAGSWVEIMDAPHHDLVLAMTSHVPHLIAYSIVKTADDLEKVTESEVIKFAAGGFRDFTRIAASDPIMWRDVFLKNKEIVLEILGRFNEDLTALQKAIRWEDGETLEKIFSNTRKIRRSIIDAGQAEFEPEKALRINKK
tara:strand:- start:1374 stop:2195 length:822 start_codon:yes stop_codon:yes gene_type:complete